jgi:hypothetical protein
MFVVQKLSHNYLFHMALYHKHQRHPSRAAWDGISTLPVTRLCDFCSVRAFYIFKIVYNAEVTQPVINTPCSV